MLKKILVGVVVLIAALVVVIALQPDHYSVSRSASIAAPASAVFARVNDLAAWDAWSPWKKLDPLARITISSPSAGQGASMSWAGNSEIGEGTMTILESRPDALVVSEQKFVKPFEGTARSHFTFAAEGSGTKVTWTMEGENNFIGKAVCLVMNMDKTIGPAFEEGLGNLKGVAEKGR
ncbi:MAG: SRPBCC family protein [Acidobacteria bacterium]|nr:SRPBCC family protein [Acidobacteriota bacterium]